MDDQSTAKIQAGQLIFYALMLIIGLIFIALLPVETDLGPEGQGWWTQPRLMPALSLGLIAITAAILVIQEAVKIARQRAAERPTRQAYGMELLDWVRSLEFLFYFYIYVQLFTWIGYFLSSLIFIVALCVRVGLRGPRWYLIGGITAVVLVAVFKWPWWGYGLQVFMPRPELFSAFPDLIPNSVEVFWQKWL